MPQVPMITVERTFAPPNPAAAHSRVIFPARRGWRIHAVTMKRIQSAAAGCTGLISLRATAPAGGAAGGLLAPTTSEGAVGALVNAPGADLAASGGHLCIADGGIEAVYDPGGVPLAVAPIVAFVVTYAPEIRH